MYLLPHTNKGWEVVQLFNCKDWKQIVSSHLCPRAGSWGRWGCCPWVVQLQCGASWFGLFWWVKTPFFFFNLSGYVSLNFEIWSSPAVTSNKPSPELLIHRWNGVNRIQGWAPAPHLQLCRAGGDTHVCSWIGKGCMWHFPPWYLGNKLFEDQ